jgi:hypothetical protein
MNNNTSVLKARKWIIVVSAVAFTCAAVVFATVGLSKFRPSQAAQIHVLNDTQGLELVAHQNTDGRTRLEFKNVSTKDLTGFLLAVPNQGKVEYDTTTGDRVISPGETQDIVIPGPVPTITILAVMYADGTLEGNETTVAELQKSRSALKVELRRMLGLIIAEAQSRDADIPGAFDRLESAILKLPSTPGDSTNALEGAKGDLAALIDVMRTRQQRKPHLKQRDLIQQIKERIERRIAGL